PALRRTATASALSARDAYPVVTGPFAVTESRPPSSTARMDGTSSLSVAYTRSLPPSPGSTASSPSPWKPCAGPGSPGRYDMTCVGARTGRYEVPSTGYQVDGLQLCQPCSYTRARAGSTARSSTGTNVIAVP